MHGVMNMKYISLHKIPMTINQSFVALCQSINHSLNYVNMMTFMKMISMIRVTVNMVMEPDALQIIRSSTSIFEKLYYVNNYYNCLEWNGNSLNYVCCIMMQLLFDVVKELNHLYVPKNEI